MMAKGNSLGMVKMSMDIFLIRRQASDKKDFYTHIISLEVIDYGHQKTNVRCHSNKIFDRC
jgi:hypothetical protein